MANKFSITAFLGLDSRPMKKGLKGAKKDAKGAGKSMGTSLGKAGTMLKAAVVAGAAAAFAAALISVGKFVKNALGEFALFEKGMLEVFTLLPGVTKKEMGKMSKQALDLAKDLGVMPDTVVPALYQALSAGVPKKNVFKFMEVASKAAIGGVSTTEAAVTALTQVVNVYGEDNITAQEAADAMFAAVKSGVTTFDQLSSTMYNVLPIAKAMGADFDTVMASVVTLTKKGVPTAQAMTQIRAAMQALGSPTIEQAAYMEKLGVNIEEMKAEIKKPGGLLKAMQQVQKAADGDNEKLRKLLGSVEGLQAVLAITDDDAKVFASALDDMANKAGASEGAFKTMDQGISRSMDKVKSSFKVAMIRIGDAAKPIANAVLPLLVQVAEDFADLDWKSLGQLIKDTMDSMKPAFDQLKDAMKEIMKTFIPLLKLIFKGSGDSAFMSDMVMLLAQSLMLIARVMNPLLRMLLKFTSGNKKSSNSLWILLKPMGLFFGMIKLWVKGLAKVTTWINNVIDDVGDFVSSLGPAQTKLWSIEHLFNKLLVAVMNLAKKGWAAMKKWFPKLWKLAKQTLVRMGRKFNDLFPLVSGVFLAIVSEVKSRTKNILTAFKTLFPGASKVITKIQSFFYSAFAKMLGKVKKILATGAKIASKLGLAMGGVMKTLVKDINQVEQDATDERKRMAVAEHQLKIKASKVELKEYNDDVADKVAADKKAAQQKLMFQRKTLMALGYNQKQVLAMTGTQVQKLFNQNGKAATGMLAKVKQVNSVQIAIMRKAMIKMGYNAQQINAMEQADLRKQWVKTGKKGKQVFASLWAVEQKNNKNRTAYNVTLAAQQKKYKGLDMRQIKALDAREKVAASNRKKEIKALATARAKAAALQASEAKKVHALNVKQANSEIAMAMKGAGIVTKTDQARIARINKLKNALKHAGNEQERINLLNQYQMTLLSGTLQGGATGATGATGGTGATAGTGAGLGPPPRGGIKPGGVTVGTGAGPTNMLKIFKTMNGYLKSIDSTLKGKFVNQ